MKVGAIEKISEDAEEAVLRFSSGKRIGSGGSGGNDGGDGGGDNGGGGSRDNFKPQNNYEKEGDEIPRDKFRIFMWFLIPVVIMTFGGLIGAYIVISTNGVLEWKPFALPAQIWISTILILASSVAYTIADKSLQKENQTKAKNWFLATTVLGGMFIASQILAWFELVRRGVYMHENPYAGFFYILTAVHAVHVIGGIVALGYVVLSIWNKAQYREELDRRKSFSSVIGWYWHFMDGLWLVILVLLGFWK